MWSQPGYTPPCTLPPLCSRSLSFFLPHSLLLSPSIFSLPSYYMPPSVFSPSIFSPNSPPLSALVPHMLVLLQDRVYDTSNTAESLMNELKTTVRLLAPASGKQFPFLGGPLIINFAFKPWACCDEFRPLQTSYDMTSSELD